MANNKAEIIAVANQKGGIGKTTTALALYSELRRRGKRVLYVDLDPQYNGTDTFRAEIDGVGTVYDLMIEGDPDCIQHTEHGDIIAGDPQMKNATKLLDGLSAAFKLRKGLKAFEQAYDYIILDTPPGLSVLLNNALTAAHKVIIPLTADRYGLQGMMQLQETISDILEYSNPDLKVDGLLLIKYNDRTKLSKEIVQSLPEYAALFQTKVYETKIRESIKAREAQAGRLSLFDWAPDCTTALDYVKLVDEILNG